MGITNIAANSERPIAAASRQIRRLTRTSAALATPFNGAGGIDWQRQTRHASKLLASGLSSVTLFGTTGEGASVAHAERREGPGQFAKAGIDPQRIIVAVYASAPADAIAAGRDALKSGCGGLLMLPPFYYPEPGDSGLHRWFAEVFEGLGAAARDIILYHIPGVTHVGISIDLVSTLRRDFPEIVAGVKDSGGAWDFTRALLAEHHDLAILIGNESDLAAGVDLGAAGTISGIANFKPELVRSLADGNGDARAATLVDLILAHPVVPAVKALTASATGDPAWRAVRAPLTALDEAASVALCDGFDRLFADAVG